MSHTITELTLMESRLVRKGHFQPDRQRVITDLLEDNCFEVLQCAGPYCVSLGIEENRLVLDIQGQDNVLVKESMTALRRIMKDYAIICESYVEAVRHADPRKVEAIDMGRRGVHNEGAEILQQMLEETIEMDFETSRKLFTLIHYLYQL